MSSRKDSRHCRVAIGVVLAATSIIQAGSAGAIPMPDPVARVPLVGLLPRWTWDPSARPRPDSEDDGASRDDVDAALSFVARLLTDQGETVDSIAGYRLDDPKLVAVVAALAPRDENGLRTAIALAFTVRVTANTDGTYATTLEGEER